MEGTTLMATKLLVYQFKDFTRITKTGQLEYKDKEQLVRDFAEAATSHPDHNILLDMRSVSIGVVDILKAQEMNIYLAAWQALEGFIEKMASLVRIEEYQLHRARQAEYAKDGFYKEDFQFAHFIDFKLAIEWLAEITPSMVSSDGCETYEPVADTPPPVDDQLLTVEQACEFLQLPKSKLLKKRRLSGLPSLQFGPRDIRFSKDELIEWGRTQAGRREENP